MRIRSYALALITTTALMACSNNAEQSSGAKQSSGAEQSTDLYINGTVITVNPEQPRAQAVAVRDGRILAVGDNAEVAAKAGAKATVRDLEGATLLPGFIDAHGHISFTGFNLASANVSSPPVGAANTVNDVVALLKTFADQNPDDEWITGWGYDDSLLAEQRHPNRHELDQVSTQRPVAIRHVSGHFMACSTLCLEAAGINSDMPNPDGGIIRREANGQQPDGVLEETAMAPLFAVMPELSREKRLALLAKTQEYYASYGVTTVQDGAARANEIDLLREAASKGDLYLDVVAYPYAQYMGDELANYGPSEYKGNFRVGGFKIVLDGSPQGKTAWLTKAYIHPPHGQNEDYKGYATLKDEQVQQHVNRALKNNIQLLAHANGDAAADQLLTALSNGASEFGLEDHRTVMIHAQTAREDQIDKMVKLAVIPSYFSAHTFYWGDWHRDSVFGEERASRISPLRSSADKGLRYTTHNDTPIVPPDMMRLWWASVNRITRSGKVLGEAQRATTMEALRSITIDAAFQYFEEDQKGSIEPGKLADLVILAEDPFDVAPESIKDIDVLETIKDGVSVFRK